MDLFLLILSFLIMIVGIVGSVIPVLPGPLSSWLGLFMFSNISTVKVDSKILIITLIIALIIFILDYIIPIYTSKKFGASKFGIIGASIGTLIGLFLPPFGIIFGALIGAIAGELFLNKNFEKFTALSSFLTLSDIINTIAKQIEHVTAKRLPCIR